MDGERCHVCDRPDGWARPPHGVDGGCECQECCALCWGGPQCASGSVDWRARALAAERDLALSLDAGWQAAARDRIATLEAEVLALKVDAAPVGKKAAGRLLDGRTWDELPTVTDERMARLPVWAREHIAQLTRERDDARRTRDDAERRMAGDVDGTSDTLLHTGHHEMGRDYLPLARGKKQEPAALPGAGRLDPQKPWSDGHRGCRTTYSECPSCPTRSAT